MVKNFFFGEYSKKVKIVLFFIIFLLVSNNSYSDVYRVENTIIQEKFKNSKDFRDNLINRGIIASFEKLSRRLMVEREFWKIKNIESNNIRELVNEISFLDEKKINENYQISISVLFDKNKVRKFFNQKNIIYTESVSDPILVFPIIKDKNTLNLWNDNFFIKNWNVLNTNYLVDFLLPEGDLTDQKNILLNSNEVKFIDQKKVVQKYGLSNSLVLLVDLDLEKDNVSYKLNLANTNYYKKFTKKFITKNYDKGFAEIVEEVRQSVENTWKNKNTIFSGSALSLEFIHNVKNLKSLNKLRNDLRSINSIKEIKNLEISSKTYRGKIYFSGTIEDLRSNLEYKNIILKETANLWIIINNE